MKKSILFMLCAAVGVMLAGCSGPGEKTEEGMQQISALQYSDALVFFDEAEEGGEDPKLIARGRGIAYLGQTDYEAAAGEFLKALSESNGFVQDVDFDINYYLADAYIGMGDYEKAEDTYTSVLDLREEARGFYLRGCARLRQDKFTLSKEDFDKAVELAPKDIDMVIRIYSVLAGNNYREAGEEYLTAALEGEDRNLSALNKGKIYYYLGDYQSAAVSLEEARSADGNDSEASLYLGRAYEAVGEYNYASNVYESFLARNPKAAAVYNQLALCEMAMGDYEGALENIDNGMQTGDTDTMRSLSFNEIVAYEYLGEFEKAKALMNSYLASYPDDAEALREMEFLKTR